MSKLQTIQPKLGRTYIIARLQDMGFDNNPRYQVELIRPSGSSEFISWEQLVDQELDLGIIDDFKVWEVIEQ